MYMCVHTLHSLKHHIHVHVCITWCLSECLVTIVYLVFFFSFGSFSSVIMYSAWLGLFGVLFIITTRDERRMSCELGCGRALLWNALPVGSSLERPNVRAR